MPRPTPILASPWRWCSGFGDDEGDGDDGDPGLHACLRSAGNAGQAGGLLRNTPPRLYLFLGYRARPVTITRAIIRLIGIRLRSPPYRRARSRTASIQAPHAERGRPSQYRSAWPSPPGRARPDDGNRDTRRSAASEPPRHSRGSLVGRDQTSPPQSGGCRMGYQSE